MQHIFQDRSFERTAELLMLLNPACQHNFKSAADLAQFMKKETEWCNCPGYLSTLGFYISTYYDGGTDTLGHVASLDSYTVNEYLKSQTAVTA
jgi:hypothetical protein